MEKVLPSEILLYIFEYYLSCTDIQAVYDTCTYWRNIIDNFNIWKIYWARLLNYNSDEFCLKNHSIQTLKEINVDNINLHQPYNRLYNIMHSKFNKSVSKCYADSSYLKYYVGLLKTHNSHIGVYFKDACRRMCIRVSCFVKVTNEVNAENDRAYRQFRTPTVIIKSLDKLFYGARSYHKRRIGQLVYSYPMSLHKGLKDDLIKQFFESYHIMELILVPRVVMLCDNLDIVNAVVVFSTSKSTEIAVVINGFIPENRWCEVPIGGWKVAEYLHNTFQWIYPGRNLRIKQFDDEQVKTHCWIKSNFNTNEKFEQHKFFNIKNLHDDNLESYILKSEQYVAAEIMYAELQLCALIQNLLEGLPDKVISNCLNHVLLVGGNCKLKHLSTRVKLDLMKTFPRFENVISTNTFCNRTLAYQMPLFNMQDEMQNTFEPGKKCRLRIEDYIMNGNTETLIKPSTEQENQFLDASSSEV